MLPEWPLGILTEPGRPETWVGTHERERKNGDKANGHGRGRELARGARLRKTQQKTDKDLACMSLGGGDCQVQVALSSCSACFPFA